MTTWNDSQGLLKNSLVKVGRPDPSDARRQHHDSMDRSRDLADPASPRLFPKNVDRGLQRWNVVAPQPPIGRSLLSETKRRRSLKGKKREVTKIIHVARSWPLGRWLESVFRLVGGRGARPLPAVEEPPGGTGPSCRPQWGPIVSLDLKLKFPVLGLLFWPRGYPSWAGWLGRKNHRPIVN